jgi:hypothetical protein
VSRELAGVGIAETSPLQPALIQPGQAQIHHDQFFVHFIHHYRYLTVITARQAYKPTKMGRLM